MSTNHNHPPSSDPTQEFIDTIKHDLPLIMSGSGDAPHPSQINPATAELLAILTAQYIEKLVGAAVDAHDILTDGRSGAFPKPSFSKKNQGVSSLNVDNWEEDLPVPKIRRKNGTSGDVADGDFVGQGAGTVHDDGDENRVDNQEREEIYARGIELYPNRIRNEQEGMSSFIGLQSFIFPICHDAEMYTKVKDHKAFKRQLEEVLIDPGVMGLIGEEHESGEFLANSLFHFVTAEKEQQQQQQSQQQQDGLDKTKASSEKDVAKRKEMTRRLITRTGLEAEIPGIDEMLILPSHTTKDLE